jgi:DNA-binding CsgD family transcriptional regulator
MRITDERKERIIDLKYDQGKTTREIAKIEKVSIRDISSVLKEEELKRQKHKDQELCSKAYKQFSEGKIPVEVAIILKLREPEVTKLYREYRKLQGSHKFNLIYEEIGDDNIKDFVEFYNRAKERGMGRMHMVKALAIANEDLPYLEEKCELLKIEINDLESKKQPLKNELYILNDKIASSKELLKSYTNSCERKLQELVILNNEISRLEALVTHFKNNNEEYLRIERTVEEKIKNVLADSKALLHKAIFSIIETLRNGNNITKDRLISFLAKEAMVVSHYRDYNYVSSTSTSSSSSSYAEHNLAQHIEDSKDTILEEAEKLYSHMTKDLTDIIIDNTAYKIMPSPVPSNLPTRLRFHMQRFTYTKEDPKVDDNDDNKDNNNDDDK